MIEGMKLTNDGRNLYIRMLAGDAQLKVSKVVIGDGSLETNVDIDTLTNLVNELYTEYEPVVKIIDNDTARIEFSYTSATVASGFFFREIGIFAEDPEKGEILFAYKNFGEKAEYIHAVDTSIHVSRTLRILIKIANASKVIFEILPTDTETINDINNQVNHVYEVALEINDKIGTPDDMPSPKGRTVFSVLKHLVLMLDAKISSLAPKITALTNQIWTNQKADYIDDYISSRASKEDITTLDLAIDKLPKESGTIIWENYTPGTYTVATHGKNTMRVTACGGGGRGADGSTQVNVHGGGGGGAAAILEREYNISSFGSLTIVIGTGATTQATSGQPTIITGNILNDSGQTISTVGLVTLLGGQNGRVTGSIPQVTTPGNAGGVGGGNGGGNHGGGSIGGGGFGSGGNSSKGGNGILGNGAGIGNTGSLSPTAGATNGAGSPSNGMNGGNGRMGSGGGGGQAALQGTANFGTGGNGGDGYVRIRY